MLMKILHLIDSLDYHASARQLCLLAPAMVNADTSIEVCCLGAPTPWSQSLRQARVTVHELAWTRWIDFSALRRLRDLVCQARFDMIHVWRLPALRALAVVARDLLPRVVMSAPLPSSGKVGRLDRWLLSKVQYLVLAGASDQERCHVLNLAVPMQIVPSVVECQRSD